MCARRIMDLVKTVAFRSRHKSCSQSLRVPSRDCRSFSPKFKGTSQPQRSSMATSSPKPRRAEALGNQNTAKKWVRGTSVCYESMTGSQQRFARLAPRFQQISAFTNSRSPSDGKSASASRSSRPQWPSGHSQRAKRSRHVLRSTAWDS